MKGAFATAGFESSQHDGGLCLASATHGGEREQFFGFEEARRLVFLDLFDLFEVSGDSRLYYLMKIFMCWEFVYWDGADAFSSYNGYIEAFTVVKRNSERFVFRGGFDAGIDVFRYRWERSSRTAP